MTKTPTWAVTSGIVAVFVVSSASVAQVATTAGSTSTLETVIVTAEKRQEPLKDVPMAITALTGSQLRAMGADSLEDYARDVPSLNFASLGPGGRVRLSIRGINPTSGAPTVGFYINDTPIPTNAGFINLINIDPNLPDVERIEVLRGPQGTLYGSGSMAGLVKVVTNPPDPRTYAANVDATLSFTEHGGLNNQLDGVLNSPIIADKLAARVVAYHRDDSGFIDRIYGPTAGEFFPTETLGVARHSNSARVDGARAELGFFPLDSLRISLNAYGEITHMDGYPAIDGGPTNPTGGLVFRQPLDVSEPYDTNWQLYTFNVNWDPLDNLNVVSDTSEFHRYFDLVDDGTEQLQGIFGGPFVAAPIEEITKARSFTQELRFSTIHRVHGFNLILGLFYQKTDADRGSDWVVPGVNAVYEPLGIPIPNDNLYTAQDGFSNLEKAVYGQIDYQLLKKWDFTFGFRRFALSNSENDITAGAFANGVATRTSEGASNNKTNFSGTVAWHPTQNDMFYLRAAQGLRPGQGIGPLPSPCDGDLVAAGFDPNHLPTQVNPDSIWDYEIGGKTNWARSRLAVNGTLYWIDWKQIQQTLLLACGFNINQNAGSALSRGVELEIDALPTDSLELALSGAFTDAHLTANAPQLNGKNGDRIQEVPRIQLGGSATYQFPAVGQFTGYLHGDIQYIGDSWMYFSETDPLTKRPSYALLNVRAGLRSDVWDYAIFIDNALDRRADLGHPDALTFNIATRPRIVVSRPRTIGLSIRRVF